MLEQLLKHVEAAPADPRVRLRLGDVLQSLNRIEEAVIQYREAAALLQRRGFTKQGRAVHALILRLLPGDPGALRDLAFQTDAELARTQAPLSREEKPIADEPLEIEVTAGGAAGFRTEQNAPVKRPPSPPLKALPEAPWTASTTDIRFETRRVPEFSLTGDGIVVDVTPVTPLSDARKSEARPRERREDPRAHADGVVRLHANGISTTGFLEDISQTGMFVVGPRPFPKGAIIDVALQLPQSSWIGLARARVMRSVEASRRREAGLGLGLLWADSATERWIEDFVAAVFGTAVIRRGARFGNGAAEDIRRQHIRGQVDLPAVIRGAEFEVSGWIRDLSLGGAFVEGPRVFGPGRRLEVLLWMPGHYAPLVVEAVVAHDSRPPMNGNGAGTGLRFIKVGEALQGELRKVLEQVNAAPAPG